ncbi:uncharacterized protein N7459_005952 [Penicillium hispanicum]|uniref:uncharacterized protein n=1 Tax=Penicillium hispanicum TaxID=1080232 RepID=UPI0025418985|nr:uncharacterized protein N7459_005952 [Penicillium hispanicum]KAJ5579967.1 hypothetical protein N7459_005952 [Penicillium hispanicum]
MLLSILLQVFLAAVVLAVPAFFKRDSPTISDKFATAQQRVQAVDAASDALTISKSVLTAPETIIDAILPNWFYPTDKSTVLEVFQDITGPSPYDGSELLGEGFIRPDYPDSQGNYNCLPEDDAETTTYEGHDAASIVICDRGFRNGGIDKSYGTGNSRVEAVTCDSLDTRVSDAMVTLGSILIHEYSHWTALVSPPLKEGTDDHTHATAYDTFVGDKALALDNAESFHWFANQVFWTVKCGRAFAAPEPGARSRVHRLHLPCGFDSNLIANPLGAPTDFLQGQLLNKMAQENPGPVSGGRLLNTFINRSVEDYVSGWSKLWDAGESDLWDRGKASPALVDLVEKEKQLLNPMTPEGRRKKALVPGCGRGYDVVMLALHGFDAYGLEISETAVKEAEAYADAEIASPSSYHFGPDQHWSGSRGSATFLQGDFFSSQWALKSSVDHSTKFDVIYDYTFLCALHPEQRKSWAKSMARAVKPGGLLICLEFPMYKSPRLPGPPWGLKGVHWNLLSQGLDGVVVGDVGDDGKEKDAEEREDGEFRRILYMKPARSYEVAKGTDMLSVYTRK